MNNRLLNLQNKLDLNITGCIIESDINRKYFLNFSSTAGTLIITKEKSFFIIDFRYIEKAKREIKNCEIILQENLYLQILEILKKENISNIVIESYSMTISKYQKYKEIFDKNNINIDITNKFNDIIKNMRSSKSEEEIEYMKHAQKIAEKGLDHILKFIKIGVSEKEIALELEFYLKKYGAEGLSFPIIAASGKNSSSPHAVPTDKKVENGDFIILDFGVIYKNYCSDMTRTIGIGEISKEQDMVYNIVLESQIRAIKAISSGVSCKLIDNIAREYIYQQGYEGKFGHGLGHSIGIEVHESPFFNSKSEDILSENTVMTVEPGIYLEGKFGVRIEDMVIAKPDGYEIITNAKKTLIIL